MSQRTIPDRLKKTSKVVHQLDFVAVKEISIPAHQCEDPFNRGKFFPVAATKSYDIWSWNILKQKWTRLSNTACGFGSKSDAVVSAKLINDELVDGLKAIGLSNWMVPPL